MKRIGVDTNVVVSFVTDRNASQQARAARLFEAATAGDLVVVLHSIVISEAVYVLCNAYGTDARVVSAVMRDVLSLPGVVALERVDWPAVWRSWPDRSPDFGDACLTVLGRDSAFDELATFDARLARRARGQGVPTHW